MVDGEILKLHLMEHSLIIRYALSIFIDWNLEACQHIYELFEERFMDLYYLRAVYT